MRLPIWKPEMERVTERPDGKTAAEVRANYKALVAAQQKRLRRKQRRNKEALAGGWQ